jgi:hypothetical protein
MSGPYVCPRCRAASHHPLDVENRYCGSCHAFEDQLLCLRVVVAGTVQSERWFVAEAVGVDAGAAEGLADGQIAAAAAASGLSWRLEVYDPESGTTAVIGSSEEQMRTPKRVDLADPGAILRDVERILGWLPDDPETPESPG